MKILTVVAGLVFILNGELLASVQTAQAHNAVFLNPCWFSIFQFNGSNRTVLCAQTTANTAVLHMEMAGFAESFVEAGIDQFHHLSQLILHKITAGLLPVAEK